MESPVVTILIFSSFLSFTFLPTPNFVTTSNALQLTLIPPNSHESPLYVKNLTRQQRIETLLHHSINQAHSLASQSINNFTNLALMTQQDLVVKQTSLILIKIGIGTFDTPIPYKTYYLHMDTSSELTWLQCEDCRLPGHKCFGMPPAFFETSKSATYHPTPCNSKADCYTNGNCYNGFCFYTYKYNSVLVKGALASEKFTFGTGPRLNDITNEANYNLIFGCNVYYFGQITGRGDLGIMGLGMGPLSFITQITKDHPQDNTFSYCFPHYERTDALGALGYFKIGSDGDSLTDYKSTPFTRLEQYSPYFLELGAIGLLHIQVIKPAYFKNNERRVIFDSSAYFSSIITRIFVELVRNLKSYFEDMRINVLIVQPPGNRENFDLCYKTFEDRGTAEHKLPSVSFHFANKAELKFKPQNVWIWLSREVFCLAMHPHDSVTFIGAYQQSDFKFVIDRTKMLLHFKPDNDNYCEQDA